MLTLIYVVFTIVCIFLIITVLLQPGKSGGLGAAFGGGGNTVFGSSGGTPVFRKLTTGAAICFMLLSLLLAYVSLDKSVTDTKTVKSRGLDYSELEIPVAETQPPAAPGTDTNPGSTNPAP